MTDEKTPRTDLVKFSEFTSVTGEDIEGVGLKDGQNVRFALTTDAVQVNPNTFRNARGQFTGTPEELEALKNQRDVNEFLYTAVTDIEQGAVDIEARLNEVDADSIEGDEKLQEQIDVNKADSESGDRHLQAEIEEIGLALETLLVQRAHGRWTYIGFAGDNVPRKPGEFALASDDLSAINNIITLNQEDLGGITHGFGDVSVDDYIEIVDLDNPGNYVLFVVKKEPEGSGITTVEVGLKDKGNSFLVGETCEIRFFAINEQDIPLTDLDNRYLKLSGGTMSSSARIKVNTIEPVDMPFIHYEGDPENTHEAGLINRSMMMKYVDSKVKGAFVNHMEWLYTRLNWDWDGHSFQFLDANGKQTLKLDEVRSLLWQTYPGHYLQNVVADCGPASWAVFGTSTITYQAPVTGVAIDGEWITIEFDHEQWFGSSSQITDRSWLNARFLNCFRES